MYKLRGAYALSIDEEEEDSGISASPDVAKLASKLGYMISSETGEDGKTSVTKIRDPSGEHYNSTLQTDARTTNDVGAGALQSNASRLRKTSTSSSMIAKSLVRTKKKVISKEVLTDSTSRVLMPKHVTQWETLIAVLVVMQIIYMPYTLAFDPDWGIGFEGFETAVDASFIADLFLQFNVAYRLDVDKDASKKAENSRGGGFDDREDEKLGSKQDVEVSAAVWAGRSSKLSSSSSIVVVIVSS